MQLPPLRRPNVLWIFGDQHRAQATGYRGDPNVSTPNIDNLGRIRQALIDHWTATPT